MSHETALLLCLGVPLGGTALILLAGRLPNLREAATLLTAGAVFGLVVSLLPAALSGRTVSATLIEVMPGVPLALALEPLGLLYALVATLLWIPNSVYSIGYMRANREKHQTRFYACFALSILASVGIAFSANVFTMFVFYEMLTLTTLPLVMHRQTPEAVRSGRTYLGVLLTTSICFQLAAVIWIAALARRGVIPGIGFAPGGLFADALQTGAVAAPALGLLFFLYIYGIGKAALMPVHRWLPAAMVAPTPVSAFLHAVAVVKAGVFCVIKVITQVFGVETLRHSGQSQWLVYVAGATIVLASLIALFQDDLKRRLAYSTISQLGYVVMAAALLTPLAIFAAALHLMTHAMGKITLFFAAGSVYTAAHKTRASELDGIGRLMPWTMGAFTIGAISMIGLPPAAGFVSKFAVVRGAAQGLVQGGSGSAEVFALFVVVVSTLLNAGYFLPIVYRAFFRPPPRGQQRHGESPAPMVFALGFTASLVLLFFAWPDALVTLARAAMEAST